MTGIVEGILVYAGVSAGTAAAVAEGVAVAGAVASAASAVATPIIAGKQQERIGKANAQALEQEARDRALQGSIAAERERRRNRLIIAQQRAGAAEAGALSGSTLDLLDANSVALELDALTVEYQGKLGANQSRRQAELVRADARAASSGGFLSGIGGGLASAGRAFNDFDPLNLESSGYAYHGYP